MKKITYGNHWTPPKGIELPQRPSKTFYQIENFYEAGTRRISEINQYLCKAETGHTAVDLSKNLDKFREAFDATKLADGWEFLYKASENAKNIAEGFSPFEYMHAILVLDEKELSEPGLTQWLQPTFLKEKIEAFRDLNVTNLDVAEINQFFFLSCYPHWPIASHKALSQLLAYCQAMTALQKSLESLEQTTNLPKEEKS